MRTNRVKARGRRANRRKCRAGGIFFARAHVGRRAAANAQPGGRGARERNEHDNPDGEERRPGDAKAEIMPEWTRRF